MKNNLLIALSIILIVFLFLETLYIAGFWLGLIIFILTMFGLYRQYKKKKDVD